MRRMLFTGGMAAAMCWSVPVQASTFQIGELDSGTSCGQTVVSATALLGQTLTCAGANYSMLFKNEASESFLKAYSDIDRTGATGRLIADSYSTSFTMLTITGGSGTGSLEFQIDLSGQSGPGGCSGNGPDFSCATLAVYGNPGISFALEAKDDATLTGTIPFTFDVPFQFRMYLEAYVEVPEGVSSVFRYTDFYNTAVLAPFIVLDSAGAAVGGASALSDAGYSYQIQTPSAVPEPASLLLLCTGLAGLAIVRRERKAKA